MKLAICIDGEKYEVAPKPGDLVRLEREYEISASALDENAKLEHILFLAWCGLRRSGHFAGDFEEFLDKADMDAGEAGDIPLSPPTLQD